jgi:hypothetical protein
MELSDINYYISSFYYVNLQIISLFIIFTSIFQNNFIWGFVNSFIIFTNSSDVLLIRDNEYNNFRIHDYTIVYNIYHFITSSLFLTSFLDIIYGNFYWYTITLIFIKYFVISILY